MEIRVRLDHPVALDAHFEVERLTVLLGPSGAGKTTLLKAIAGLLPARGSPFGGLPPERRPIGYMPQNYALFPHLTARQNVEFPLAHLPRGVRGARALGLMDKMGIAALAERRPRQLSGGEQQRVALARALAREPELLLLDEPMSALDLPTRNELSEGLVELVESLGIPALVVTHDVSMARISDRVAVMAAGRVLQTGTPEDVFLRPAHSTVARLVGFRNLFHGTVCEVRPPWLWMKTPLGAIQALGPDWAERGSEVVCCVAADRICWTAGALAEGRAGSRLQGVIERPHRNAQFRVRVHEASVLVHVTTSTHNPPPPGEPLELFIPAEAVHVMEA